jgi:hypothetical protein
MAAFSIFPSQFSIYTEPAYAYRDRYPTNP